MIYTVKYFVMFISEKKSVTKSVSLYLIVNDVAYIQIQWKLKTDRVLASACFDIHI